MISNSSLNSHVFWENPASHPFLQAPLLRQERSWVKTLKTAAVAYFPQPRLGLFLPQSGAKTSWWWCSVLWGIIFHQHMCGHFPMFPLLMSKILPPPLNMLFLSDSPFWDKSLFPPPSICCHMDMIFQAAVKYTVSESFSTYNSSNF